MVMAYRGVSVLGVFLAAMLLFAPAASANSKYAAYVVHADSGDVLFDRYSNGRRYPASLTKMMTLYLLFEEIEAGELKLNSKIKISARAAGQPPSKLGVKKGSTIEVETAIKALVVKSANDVAVAVSEQISGSEWRFAQKMTTKARQLGMSRTTFRNASGLPNSKQVTTAKDMATLSRRMMQDFPQYFHYFSTQRFSWNGRNYRTHNALVRTFDGADGLKTGYTRRSGFNLATTADRDGNRLVGIVLGGRSSATRDRHMREILNNAFTRIKKKPALIASLHRNKPTPRLKPTLAAAMAARTAVPTIADNEALREELVLAAAIIEGGDAAASDTTGPSTDSIGALIALADTDDFNEFERTRLASLSALEFVGEGDLETLTEANWSIQIGAFSTKEMAQNELESAVSKAGMDQARARAVLPTTTINTGKKAAKTLYRARITDLTAIEAGAACETLKAKNLSCFIVSGTDATLN